MLGLRIHDELRWHDRWLAGIGERLRVADSSNDLFIFDAAHSRDEILAVLGTVPEELYELVEVAEAPEEDCDYQADSGRCYRHTH
jgi:hypothetical protein